MLAALDLTSGQYKGTPETAADVDSKRNLKHLPGPQLWDWDYCRHVERAKRSPTNKIILQRTQFGEMH